MGTVPVFASATEAMQMVRAGLDYLAATDATAMAAEEQARSLRALEQVNSVATAVRTSILGAYTAGQGYTADADYSSRAWLIHKTGVTRGAAVACTAWVRRSEAHPRVAEALAAGEISESVARTLCLWTNKLPEERRADADKILADAAVCGLGLADLAVHRAEVAEGGGDIGAWLNGDAAKAVACDAAMAPIVTGEVNPDALEDLVRLCVQLDKLRRHGTPDSDGTDTGSPADTSRAWEAIEQAVIGKAVDLLSGPGGLASFLRRRQLGVRLGGPSLPLDIGYAETVPAGIRNAVILRDKHCRWAGGCNQPASACEVHHVRHKANGGKTSTKDCLLLCFYHHQVVIHRRGWTLVLNPDGTTTAWNKDKTKVLHSHGPPARAG